MIGTFGGAHYFKRDLREDPEAAIKAALLLGGPGDEVKIQGMVAGTDRWTKLTTPSDAAIRRLVDEVGGGALSVLLALRGDKDNPQAMVTIDLIPETGKEEPAACPQSVEFTVELEKDTQLGSAEGLAKGLWSICGPEYGFCVIGSTDRELQEELSGTPISDWRSPPDTEKERRLLSIQMARHEMGTTIRGPAWGSFLGSRLVAALGGEDTVRRQAPVHAVEVLEGGGLYLRLASEPLLLGTPEYEMKSRKLGGFLVPVVARSLRTE